MSTPSSRHPRVRVVLVGAAAILAAAIANAQAPPCPDTFMGYGDLSFGEGVTCMCSAGRIVGSVWGSGRYTADSSICAAARHAGAIPASGGLVTLYRQEGCPAVVGTARNGVTSRDWGAYDPTFAFSHPAPGCTPQATEGVDPCPASLVGQESRRTGRPLECSCAPRQMTGSVWGSERYTFDSSVCAAARHAGAVGSSGGEVLVFVAGGCAGFVGSTRNGVTSANWGEFKHTFAFRYPLPACTGATTQKRPTGNERM